MSIIAVYGDVHLTRNMRQIQEDWNSSLLKIFNHLYDCFDNRNVEAAICLGDFFDKAVLEARSVKLVTEILDIINSRTYPTYLLLGNHEIDSNERNILEFLSEYENIIPVTDKLLVDDKLLFLPYGYPVEDVKEEMVGKYLFTHHDIYGSELAGGKLKASFGIDPNLFSDTLVTFNGHIHLPSTLGKVINVGSISKVAHGELSYRDYPHYYYVNTNNRDISIGYLDKYFIAYQDVNADQIDDLLSFYDESVKLVLRVSYDNEFDVLNLDHYKENPRILRLSLRKKLSTNLSGDTKTIHRKNLDAKEVVVNFIKQDASLSEEQKERITNLSLTIMGECQ